MPSIKELLPIVGVGVLMLAIWGGGNWIMRVVKGRKSEPKA